MSLRLQLLALGALTLLLPWAGLRFLEKTEVSLREVHEGQLSASAGTLAVQIGGNDALGTMSGQGALPAAPSLYAGALVDGAGRDGSRIDGPSLDGSRSDWQYEHAARGADESRAQTLADGSRIWLGVRGPFLYLFIEVPDDDIVAQAGPGRAPHGDRIALLFGRDIRPPQVVLLAVPATGNMRAQRSTGPERYESTGEFIDDVFASWGAYAATGAQSGGYRIEARVPLTVVRGALGIAVIDTDAGGSAARLAATTWGEGDPAPSELVRELPELNRMLSPFAGGESRFRVLNPEGWVLADSGPLPESSASAGGSAGTSLLERFFRYTLKRDDPAYRTLESRPGRIGDPSLIAAISGDGGTAWFGTGAESSAIVAALVPIRRDGELEGAVLLEQATDPIMTLRNKATLGLMATTVAISLIAAALLLAYASYLSFRVRRLARAAESALSPRGEIRAALPGTRARDEIGVLARSFEDLLGRLRDYTEYLQSLKSKLSHELRTPLAIVATSVDNLEQETGSDAGRAYLARLRHGAGRLESILQAMTAATRVEQAVTQTDSERFDLAAVVAACVASYRDVFRGRQFDLQLPTGQALVDGSPELIEQLLDKLIDNAASFAADGTAIEVAVTADRKELRLAVVNRGPLLPEAMRHRLFDSLVSVRESGGDRAHLGLGLYIVTLIAKFHRGRVEAENLADGSGVRIGVVLPRADGAAGAL